MQKFLEMFKKTTGRYSIAAICVTVTMVLWWLTWIFCLLAKITFSHFDTVTLANWSIFVVVVLRNSIETKLFSIKVGENNANSNKSGTQARP